MSRYFGVLSVALSCGMCFAASWDAQKVSLEEVMVALESSPVEDSAAESIRIGTMCAGVWIARGEVTGKTVFHEDFSDADGVAFRWDDGNRGKPVAKVIGPPLACGTRERPASVTCLKALPLTLATPSLCWICLLAAWETALLSWAQARKCVKRCLPAWSVCMGRS